MTKDMEKEPLLLLSPEERDLRTGRLQSLMAAHGIGAALICDNADLYYLTGRVFSGFLYLPAQGEATYFVKRPVHLGGERVVNIRKPEEIPARLAEADASVPGRVALELSAISYAMAERLVKALGIPKPDDISLLMAAARSRKTAFELSKLRLSGIKQEHVYRRIPKLYTPGMTDLGLQIEIERQLRLEGCLGQFRVAGSDMELYMGNVLVGENADAPSPYDFAMGGAGLDPSLPVGASGVAIDEGKAVMVDMNGNFTGYMTDMTRTFSRGKLPDEAMRAHRVSIDICRELARMGRPGTEAKAMYARALEMAREAGLEQYFMGHRQHAGFVGHGVGIEVNEWPVIAPRSPHVLEEGNVIALEPKFVIPGTGAVGIENTYVVGPEGDMENITRAPQEIIELYF